MHQCLMKPRVTQINEKMGGSNGNGGIIQGPKQVTVTEDIKERLGEDRSVINIDHKLC